MPSFIDHYFFQSQIMKRMNTYESGGDSDDEFIEYVFTLTKLLTENNYHLKFLNIALRKIVSNEALF